MTESTGRKVTMNTSTEAVQECALKEAETPWEPPEDLNAEKRSLRTLFMVGRKLAAALWTIAVVLCEIRDLAKAATAPPMIMNPEETKRLMKIDLERNLERYGPAAPPSAPIVGPTLAPLTPSATAPSSIPPSIAIDPPAVILCYERRIVNGRPMLCAKRRGHQGKCDFTRPS